ncbi:Hypothetical protein CGLY_16725 (plasmid) [Corynebacterium glyciniphilum AJ 3170]|uniref:DarT domain-containing protein n=1 Tax=Corynebacterium glyciniphilum AJ 3170 TaxID=1404245 RepID=X5DR81_9CORY|nr:DUF4433 domain-containing protein [Corynebacterium glyciniphilum]AHW65718.1 Hypothetical protein CGLY_16725 [Corynebacterium glyciniphilum AJ 3170]
MPARPTPTEVFHFTHVDHLATIISQGLLADTTAQHSGNLTHEVGNAQIKQQRRQRQVPTDQGLSVADHVPFYFAPRSPMMYSIAKGNVPTYQDGIGRLIYLHSDLDHLYALGYRPILTDRNAALNVAEFRQFVLQDPLEDGFIDWPLMRAKYWKSTDDAPDRRERRMAEALVQGRVGWEAITAISTRNQQVADEVNSILTGARVSLPVNVRGGWYF